MKTSVLMFVCCVGAASCHPLADAEEYVILDFTASWCGPCRQLAPTIERLRRQGAPIQPVDLDQHGDLARRLQVTSIPCCVLIHNNRVLDRAVGGEIDQQRLLAMWRRGRAAAESTGAPRPTTALETGSTTRNTPTQAALQAAVRIEVRYGSTVSHGSGTVIGVHGPDALVITCGHIFRESGGKGDIRIDLFVNGTRRSTAAKLLDFDADSRDVAVLTMRPGLKIVPMKVASRGYRPQVQSPVFSIGCDRGADPSVRPSRITAVNRYQGAPNIEASGAPVEGRSGGGLFNSAGQLIGICNAADPVDNEGIYAGLESIHWQLARIGQEQLFAATTPTGRSAESPRVGEASPAKAPVAARAGPSSIVCTWTEDGIQRRVVVDHPTREFMNRLRSASQPGAILRAQGGSR